MSAENYQSTKTIELGSCAFRQPRAASHCRFLHGYQLKAKFWFETEDLNHNHWVVDFGGFKLFRQKLQKQFDHTTCIAFDDPALDAFKQLDVMGVLDLRIMPKGTGVERIAQWCFEQCNKYLQEVNPNVRCVKVEVFEHEDNSAIYKA